METIGQTQSDVFELTRTHCRNLIKFIKLNEFDNYL